MGKRCIVLGGNGFIGQNLVKHLLSCNYEVTSFDLNEPNNKLEDVKYIAADFTNDDELLNSIENQDIIIHLISTTNPTKAIQNPYIGYSIDVVQTVKILEKIKTEDVKLIFASSGGTVYGEPDYCPINEEAKLAPINHYGMTKVTIEQIIRMYNSIYGMKNKIMRISNPYGPGQDYTKGVGVIDALIKKALVNEAVTIWGDGNNVRDYIYIDDLCMAIQLLCDYEGECTVFNIGNGYGHSINEIIDILRRVLDKDIQVDYTEVRQNDIKKIYLDTRVAKEELRFTETIGLEEGIYRYVLWLQGQTEQGKIKG